MASYSVTVDSGTEVTDAGPDTLLKCLQECSGYLVLRRDNWPDRTALARRRDAGWQIELTEGGTTRVAKVPVTDAALDVLRSWAEEDDWWQEAFTWQQVAG